MGHVSPVPELRPLEQWYCDTCDEIIAKAPDGLLIHRIEDGRACDFRIVHEGACDDAACKEKRPLRECVGAKGLAVLLSLLDPGVHHLPTFDAPKVADVRAWVELVRRLQLPHYEEARISWEDAEADFFKDVTADRIHASDYLLRMILHFEAQDAG